MSKRRWFAMGDPQAPFERFLGILREHGLLDETDGTRRLRPDVGLVSMGDHFDFPFEDHDRSLEQASQDGTDILRWLAAHPREQVVILLGNHDAARVMELAWESDASFREARRVAKEETPARFHELFPRIPKPEVALRDYSSFAAHQRALVQRLLLAGRMQLAAVAHREGTPMLLTHAGVTGREVELLGVRPVADELAAALARHLESAVDRVRPAWEKGEPVALDLSPLHAAGTTGLEGGGLLYHRASVMGEEAGGPAPVAPRRFHPSALPRGLVQVCGHTGHHKSRKELALAEDRTMQGRGGLRTLAVGPSGHRYERSVVPARPEEATMYLVDIEMSQREVTALPLFEVDELIVPPSGGAS